MARQTVESLICQGTELGGLGYCCQFAFFCLYQNTTQISERLGVTSRAIRYHKMLFLQGDMPCMERKKCLKARLQALGKLPK